MKLSTGTIVTHLAAGLALALGSTTAMAKPPFQSV